MKISNVIRTAACVVLAGVTALSLVACGTTTTSNSSSPAATTAAASTAPATSAKKYPDTITVVWYPNESASDYDSARKHFEDLIAKATGKKVEEKLTTDYNIAIEALASGKATIGGVMGALGFIQAQQSSKAVQPLFVNTGKSGTLEDAVYYSWLSVNKADAATYMKDGKITIDAIKGKKISFVSNSSTSGFLFPTTNIISHFASDKLTQDQLAQGGSGKFFSEVLFGGSHQGSAVNLLSGKADVAAFCDTELVNYAKAVSGDNKTVGSDWKINSDATAPFDTVKDKEFVIISCMPVQNGPTAYNADMLSPEDVAAIQKLFISDTVTNDPQIFAPAGATTKAFYKQSGSKNFVVVDNAWYNPIREMLK